MNTLLREYTWGQLTLMACASRLLAPETPDDPNNPTVKVGDKNRKKFKEMSSAEEAVASMSGTMTIK